MNKICPILRAGTYSANLVYPDNESYQKCIGEECELWIKRVRMVRNVDREGYCSLKGQSSKE